MLTKTSFIDWPYEVFPSSIIEMYVCPKELSNYRQQLTLSFLSINFFLRDWDRKCSSGEREFYVDIRVLCHSIRATFFEKSSLAAKHATGMAVQRLRRDVDNRGAPNHEKYHEISQLSLSTNEYRLISRIKYYLPRIFILCIMYYVHR